MMTSLATAAFGCPGRRGPRTQVTRRVDGMPQRFYVARMTSLSSHVVRRALRTTSGVLVVLVALGCAAAQEIAPPSPVGGYQGRYNNNDQSHADLCVKLRVPSAELRYLDGSSTGFSLTNEILVPKPTNGVTCPAPAMARLDARELVHLADGRAMLFHRGGWGFVGDDPASAVHFGHVLASDIDTVGLLYVRDTIVPPPGTPRGRWVEVPVEPLAGKGQEAGNGTACLARQARPLRISVQSIPNDMRYLNSRQTNAIPYAIYGNPSEDLGTPEDRARGVKYTMLTWSWINTRGGGVARALLRNGEEFFPCTDVPAIKLASVADAQSKRVTGWVSAVYGGVRAGDGSWIYGWAVEAHQRAGEGVVRHLVDGVGR